MWFMVLRLLLIKGVTGTVDGNIPTSEEFLVNLAAVTAMLDDESVTRVQIDFYQWELSLRIQTSEQGI